MSDQKEKMVCGYCFEEVDGCCQCKAELGEDDCMICYEECHYCSNDCFLGAIGAEETHLVPDEECEDALNRLLSSINSEKT